MVTLQKRLDKMRNNPRVKEGDGDETDSEEQV